MKRKHTVLRRSLKGLTVIRPRLSYGRLLVDIVNEDGHIVLSGAADYVLDTAKLRSWPVDIAPSVRMEMDRLTSSWGTF